jgi:hypothetical protein
MEGTVVLQSEQLPVSPTRCTSLGVLVDLSADTIHLYTTAPSIAAYNLSLALFLAHVMFRDEHDIFNFSVKLPVFHSASTWTENEYV